MRTEFSIPGTCCQRWGLAESPETLFYCLLLLPFYFGSTSNVIQYFQWPRSILEVTPDEKRKQNPPSPPVGMITFLSAGFAHCCKALTCCTGVLGVSERSISRGRVCAWIIGALLWKPVGKIPGKAEAVILVVQG